MRQIAYFPVLMFMGFFLGCNGGGGSSQNNFELQATDGAFPYTFVSHANITFDQIELKQDDASTTVKDLLTSPVTVDFVSLRNGLTKVLTNINVPVGTYKQINFSVSSADIVLTNGNVFNMTIPSGVIKAKIEPQLQVVTSLSSDVLLDVDLSKSFVAQCGGNTDCDADPDLLVDVTGFHFKPHMRLVNMTSAGTISGKISSKLGASTTALSQAAIVLTHTDADPADPNAVCTTTGGVQTCIETIDSVSDSSGNYKVIGLIPGAYTISVSHANVASPSGLDPNQYDSWSTASLSGSVVAGNVLTENATLNETVNP